MDQNSQFVIGRWGHFVPLAVGISTLVALWLAYPHNYEISDPSQYAWHAFLVSTGSYLKTVWAPNIFGHRFGVFVPVGIVYALFGVTPRTTDLVPLLAGLTILIVVWRVASPSAAIPGVLGVITCVPLLRGTNELFPDLIATAFLLVSTFCLWRRLSKPETPRRQAVLAVLGVLAWFFSMLAKESAWWTLPLWAGALVVDSWRKRQNTLLWFHAPACFAGVLFAASYLIFCSHYFGDALARVHAIQELTGKHAWAIRGPESLKIRLTSGAALFFWRQYGVLLVPAAVGLFVLPPSHRLWGFYTAMTVLLYWFGSTSLTSYQPLPTMWRMSLPCAPGFCICASYFFSFVALQAPRVIGQTRALLVLSLLAGLALVPSVRAYTESWRAFPDLDAMSTMNDEFHKYALKRYLLISAEKRTNAFALQYLGFTPPPNTTLRYAGDVDSQTLDGADVVFLFIDQRHQPSPRLKDFARPFRALRLPALFKRGDSVVFLAEDHATVAALLPRARK